MPCNFESDVFLCLGELVKQAGIFEQTTGNDTVYQQFITAYPPASIKELTLDQYCLGTGSIDGNFCWWLERGLEKVLGRYLPGTSKGHLLYKEKNGSIYRHRKLRGLSPEEALRYTLAIQSVIVNASWENDISWIDNDQALYDKADVEPKYTMADGRWP